MSSNAKLKAKVFKGKPRKTNKMPKMTVLAAYGGVFCSHRFGYRQWVTKLLSHHPRRIHRLPMQLRRQTPLSSPIASTESSGKPAVDEIVANDVAAHLAEQTNMPVSSYVANMSVSLAAKDYFSLIAVLSVTSKRSTPITWPSSVNTRTCHLPAGLPGKFCLCVHAQ